MIQCKAVFLQVPSSRVASRPVIGDKTDWDMGLNMSDNAIRYAKSDKRHCFAPAFCSVRMLNPSPVQALPAKQDIMDVIAVDGFKVGSRTWSSGGCTEIAETIAPSLDEDQSSLLGIHELGITDEIARPEWTVWWPS